MEALHRRNDASHRRDFCMEWSKADLLMLLQLVGYTWYVRKLHDDTAVETSVCTNLMFLVLLLLLLLLVFVGWCRNTNHLNAVFPVYSHPSKRPWQTISGL